MLPRDTALGYRAFFNSEHRLPGLAVKGKYQPHLGCLKHCRDEFPFVAQLDQGGLRGHVVIPEIVVYQLPIPGHRAIRRPQGDQ